MPKGDSPWRRGWVVDGSWRCKYCSTINGQHEEKCSKCGDEKPVLKIPIIRGN